MAMASICGGSPWRGGGTNNVDGDAEVFFVKLHQETTPSTSLE